MALALDANVAVAAAHGTTLQPITASFTPTAGSLLMAVAMGCTNGTVPGVTGGSLTWVKVTGASAVNGTSSTVTVFLANVGGSPASMTVASTGFTTGSASANGIAVLGFTGALAQASQAGSTGTLTTGVFTTGITLGSAASTSWIFGAVADFTASVTPTFPGSIVDSFNSVSMLWNDATNGDSGWVQGNNAVGNTNLKMNVSTPTGTNTGSTMTAIEIQAAGGGATAGPQFVPGRMPLRSVIPHQVLPFRQGSRDAQARPR